MASITRRTTRAGDVRYDVRVRNGDRVQNRTFRRRVDTERWARQQETGKDLGELVDVRAGAIELADYAARWLPTRELRPTCASSTATCSVSGSSRRSG